MIQREATIGDLEIDKDVLDSVNFKMNGAQKTDLFQELSETGIQLEIKVQNFMVMVLTQEPSSSS